MTDPYDPDELLTVPQAAKRLGVGKRTLWRWINAGSVPVARVEGRRTLVRARDLIHAPRPEPKGQRAPAYGLAPR